MQKDVVDAGMVWSSAIVHCVYYYLYTQLLIFCDPTITKSLILTNGIVIINVHR